VNKSHRWLVLSVFVLSSTINYLDRQTLATLAPVLRAELHLSNAQYGWIVSAFSIAYAACAPFAGLLIDRIGLDRENYEILGLPVPHVTIPVRPGRDIARLIEVAAMDQKLKGLGQNSAIEFNTKLLNLMEPGSE